MKDDVRSLKLNFPVSKKLETRYSHGAANGPSHAIQPPCRTLWQAVCGLIQTGCTLMTPVTSFPVETDSHLPVLSINAMHLYPLH